MDVFPLYRERYQMFFGEVTPKKYVRIEVLSPENPYSIYFIFVNVAISANLFYSLWSLSLSPAWSFIRALRTGANHAYSKITCDSSVLDVLLIYFISRYRQAFYYNEDFLLIFGKYFRLIILKFPLVCFHHYYLCFLGIHGAYPEFPGLVSVLRGRVSGEWASLPWGYKCRDPWLLAGLSMVPGAHCWTRCTAAPSCGCCGPRWASGGSRRGTCGRPRRAWAWGGARHSDCGPVASFSRVGRPSFGWWVLLFPIPILL